VNWILYNILVGIYQNWFRISPFILHLLPNTIKEKRENLQNIIAKAKKEEQRITTLIKEKQ
jgi:hypothetical protein